MTVQATMRKNAASRATRRTRVQDARLESLREKSVELLARIDTAAGADGAGPSKETVHRLRTGTRRCGALLESLMESPGRRDPFRECRKGCRKLLAQWKKLRRAAGTVRDLDVHIDLVAKLRRSFANSSPEAVSRLGQQLDPLEAWLHARRKESSHALQHEAEKRVGRCRALSEEILGPSLSNPAPATSGALVPAKNTSRVRQPAVLALDDFYAISQANSVLSRENLHDFRKSTKEARYVAEAGGEEAHSVAVGKALKRIQDAIGEWHDLDALCLEAAEALGKQGEELRTQLASQADKKLQSALTATERMRRRLLGERLALQPVRKRSQPRV